MCQYCSSFSIFGHVLSRQNIEMLNYKDFSLTRSITHELYVLFSSRSFVMSGGSKFTSLRSRPKKVRARERRHARGEGGPARKVPENRFNSHSVSADTSNWSKGSRGKN